MVTIRSLVTLLTYSIGLYGVMPLFPWLTMVPRTMLVIGLIFGCWQDRRGCWQPKPWMQNISIVPVFIYYALQFSRSNPIQPVISILAIMLAVRLSGEKTVRHSLQIYVLSMFCLASSSLFDVSPFFLIYLGLLLFIVAIALVLLTFQSQEITMTVTIPGLKRILYSSVLMPVLAVPLLLLFFPVLPRTPLPLWHFLNPPTSRSTGYSDTVEPGSQSNITESRTLAFRVEMPRLMQSQLYWRGTVFNHTDGLKWTRIEQPPPEQPVFFGQTIAQRIYPEPSAIRTLIALDRPAVLSLQRLKSSPDGVFTHAGPVGRRIIYAAESQSSGITALNNSVARTFYLQLPGKLPARIRALASKIALSGGDDRARVEFLKDYFRNGDYHYSMRDLPTGDSALEQFLFEKKQGHCEFFASSFALLLRAAGIPCRLVGGYLGGEYNQFGNYYLVTDDKAHVWVEAYIAGKGWMRVDPSSFATNAGDVWTAPHPNGLKRSVMLAIDSFNHSWNRSVINYDFDQQMNVAHRIGSRFQSIHVTKMLKSSVPYIIGVLFFAGSLFSVRQADLFHSRERRILRRFLLMMEHKFTISAGEGESGLFELALATGNSHVADFVAVYGGAVYRDRRLSDDEYRYLKQILRILNDNKSK